MRADRPTPIQVIHGDTLARAGLLEALSRFVEFDVVDTTRHGDSAPPGRDLTEEHVVVADLDTALGLARQDVALGSGRKGPAIIVTSGPDRERELREALESGIRGYLVDGFTVEQLADCVRAVRERSRYLCPRASARLAESICFSALTSREEAVLELVAHGLCNKSIARQLDIAVGTVKSHLKSAYGKLLVGSRTQAIMVSQRRGLLASVSSKRPSPTSLGNQRLSQFRSALH